MVTAIRFDIEEVARLIRRRTCNQVHGLEVEIWPRCIVLRGHAESYYIKQLAQHDLRQQLPADVALENLIVVSKGNVPAINYFDPSPIIRRAQPSRPLIVSNSPRALPATTRMPAADFAVA